VLISVYGTLKQGYGNNRILQGGNAVKVSEGVVRGFLLYDSGFPVAAHSDMDSIKVEVWDIGDVEDPNDSEAVVTLNRLDGLEGHRGNDNPNSMYFREVVTVHTEGGTLEANMYTGSPTFWRGFQGMRTERQDDTGIYYWDR
jgi:gamma-glutamylcyclotransferase (GGCT)/AIG2-like uncharacterized protein YtfP